MTLLSSGRNVIGLTMAALAIGACNLNPKPDPAQFYVLTTAPDTGGEGAARTDDVPAIGVGPVRFPAYLDRPQMVTRLSEVQVTISEYERWAESPQSSFTAILARNLEIELGALRIQKFPWIAEVDYSVRVDVLRFERDASGTAELRCRWVIVDDERISVFSRESTYREPAADSSTEAAVAALSRTVHLLATDVAEAMRQLPID